jgi:hypothetical protein
MPNINNPETHLYKSHDHQTTKKSISNRIPNLIMAGRINIKKSFYFLPNLRVPRQQLKSPTLNNDMSSRRKTAPRLPSPGTCQETTLSTHVRGSQQGWQQAPGMWRELLVSCRKILGAGARILV